MKHDPYTMKVVQTRLSETEYALLATYAKAHDTTIKEAVRTAIRHLTLPDAVDPEDPVFHAFPVAEKGRLGDASERSDAYLYGADE